MNELIGQLAEQARLLGPRSRIGNSHEAAEKFAELIVQECVRILTECVPIVDISVEDWDRGYDRAVIDCIHLINEHFGFKE